MTCRAVPSAVLRISRAAVPLDGMERAVERWEGTEHVQHYALESKSLRYSGREKGSTTI